MTSAEAVQPLLDGFALSLREILPVRAVWVHGSLVLGDYQVGRSDLDLVAVLDAPIADPAPLLELHRSLEKANPLADKLHCSYLRVDQLADATLRHPTWAQRRYFDRPVTAVTRRELALADHALFGPPPSSLLPATTDEELAAFVRDDLEHFWLPVTLKRRPWYTDVWVDHGPIVVARAGVTLREGRLITKRAALDLLPSLGFPTAVVTDIEQRRYGTPSATSPLWRVRRGNAARAFVRTQIRELVG
ncbi:nucleotidyltransferase domain-containing protein [Kribbella sancticallisti]|uniref:Nucleotidyltransferase domain-containing protein n=1 Tax=Kribbella sancticallisti TaxID=460087 RepID=A0ABN2EEW6_9ACTN